MKAHRCSISGRDAVIPYPPNWHGRREEDRRMSRTVATSTSWLAETPLAGGHPQMRRVVPESRWVARLPKRFRTGAGIAEQGGAIRVLLRGSAETCGFHGAASVNCPAWWAGIKRCLA